MGCDNFTKWMKFKTVLINLYSYAHMKVLVFGCVQFVSIWNTSRYKLGIIIGPSGVRALPLAAGTNEGGHYFRYFLHLVVTLVIKNPEGCVTAFYFFALAPNSQK